MILLDEIKYFLDNNYMGFLLDKNIRMVYFKKESITILSYKDEIFIFNSPRSIKQSYAFYLSDLSLLLEGLEYTKITIDYPKYMEFDDPNILNGYKFKFKKKNYLINYFSKGYKNQNGINFLKLDNHIRLLNEFCHNIVFNDILIDEEVEKTIVITNNIVKGCSIDIYSVDNYLYPNLKKEPKNNKLLESVSNKEHSYEDACIGIMFLDAYTDCFELLNNRIGGFMYFINSDSTIDIEVFDTLKKSTIINYYSEILNLQELPKSMTTDNELLYDLLCNSFKQDMDFIYNKSNRLCRFITTLTHTMITNTSYHSDLATICRFVEENTNFYKEFILNSTDADFEEMLKQTRSNFEFNEDDDFDFDDEGFEVLEDDDIEDDTTDEVDTKLLS